MIGPTQAKQDFLQGGDSGSWVLHDGFRFRLFGFGGETNGTK